MRILHTESSNGWGGQEMRILAEAIGMRALGHEVWIAVVRGGQLAKRAAEEGFTVYELNFSKMGGLRTVWALWRIIKKNNIDIINTHSSLDAWLGGIAARWARKRVVRTRHLSTAIRRGLNSWLLYNKLADRVVTTSSKVIAPIISQSGIAPKRCQLVATGVDPSKLAANLDEVAAFRKRCGAASGDCLVGTLCIVRSWKGIEEFIGAAHLLRDHKNIKWVVIGGGYVDRYRPLIKELHLEEQVLFIGHLETPAAALAALDIFALLSTAHEGISQACLQAAYLERPLIATQVGGLPEVCIEGETGILVPPFSAPDVARAVQILQREPKLREVLGRGGRRLVENKFTLHHTLEQMEHIYSELMGWQGIK